VIPALSVAMGFLATPAGLALLAIAGLTAGLIVHQVALADAEKGTRDLSEAQKSQVQATQEQINSLQRAGQEYANLREQIASGKLSVEEEKKAKADLIIIEQQLETALGKEGLARIKSAEDTRAAVNAELAALQEKLRAQKEALQKTLIMENEQTLAKIEATQKRIEAVEKEARAYTIWGKIMEAGEKASINIKERLIAAEEALGNLPGRLGEIHRQNAEKLRQTAAAHRQTLEALYSSERSAEIGRLAGELKKLRQGLHDVNIDVGINTGVTSSAAGAAGKHEKAVRQQSEALSEQEFELQKLEKRWAAYEAGAGEAANSISFLASKKEYLAAKIELLNGIIAETSAKLDEATQAGERDEAEIQKLTLKILDLQATQAGLRKQIAETNAEMERQTMALMQHQVAMRQLSADQQIEILRRLRAAHEENSRQAWQIDEQLARIYSDRIKAELKEIEQAYNDQLAAIDEAAEAQTASLRRQMDDIDERTRRTIQGLQAILDAMDEQDRLRDREKARSEHEKRLADLLEKRRYHELRTGKEHVRAIAEIDAQIAEENQRWAEEQARWEQDDRRRQIQEQIDHVQEQANIQKQALQDEIDRIQKNAAQQRKILQDHYKQVTRLTEEGIWDSIAAMAATNPKWFETGKQLIESLIAGIKSGQPQISTESQGILEAVRSEIASSQAQAGRAAAEAMREPKYTIPPGQYEMIDGRAAMWARQLGGILGAGVTWDEDTRTVIIGGKQFTPLWIEDGRAYVSVRQVAEELGHRVEYDNFSGNIRIYHAGGYVEETGPALLEAGEYVLPKKAVSEISTFGNFRSMLKEAVEEIVNAIRELRPGIIVQGPLVNNDQVVLPAGTGHNWIDFITEGAETWLRGGK
ncbi:MAG: hypothetical protein QMD10_07860, partial [Desulfitobacteriaceae bacterium]|nr:hypothetical protein [Desulfitobacteriaceae bacterium]